MRKGSVRERTKRSAVAGSAGSGGSNDGLRRCLEFTGGGKAGWCPKGNSYPCTGIEALHDVQVVLAAHTLALAVLASEVEGKVSERDVDPAIGELNERLSQARAQAEEAVEEGFEAWDAAQGEAQRTFDELQKSLSSLADRLTRKLEADST